MPILGIEYRSKYVEGGRDRDEILEVQVNVVKSRTGPESLLSTSNVSGLSPSPRGMLNAVKCPQKSSYKPWTMASNVRELSWRARDGVGWDIKLVRYT